MSGFNFANSRKTADGLIEKFGRAITLMHAINLAYDPTTGGTVNTSPGDPDADPPTEDANTEIVADGIGVVLEYSDSDRNSGEILQGDRKVLVSVSPLSTYRPSKDDICEIGADVFKVVNFSALEPNGTSVLYTLQVRK